MADERLKRITRELLFTSFLGPASGLEESWIIDRFAEGIEESVVAKGEVLFDIGDSSDSLFFMSEGRLRLQAPGRPDWVYDGRWVVGTTDQLTARKRQRRALVEQDARVFRVRGDLWTELMEDSFEATSGALFGNARAVAGLYARVGPGGGFAAPPVEDDAPMSLRVPASDSIVDRTLLLYETPMFKGAGVQPLTDLARQCSLIELRAAEDLFSAGIPPERSYVVVSGEVEVARQNPDVRARFGPRSVVGGAVCLGDPTAEWSGRATQPTRLLSLWNEDWFDEMEEHVDLARAGMAWLSLERERLFDLLAAPTGEIVLY
ncbi:MAG: cyclic nucleotide-binding domain-containing protein [Myxococcales bacterium]|nr:cyclic nucleotide-binding domain-containing protein [Myxococcales bacterium]